MEVELTQDAEIRRLSSRPKKTWALFSSTSLVQTLHKAKDMGWKDKKVQVRLERSKDSYEYFIEPFEKDCSCPNMLRYSDYFD